MFFSLIKGTNKLISKGISNIYLKALLLKYLMFSKLRFPEFRKFALRSVLGELQLKQTSLNFKNSCYNLKIRGLRAKIFAAFLLFNFERNYDVLKPKSTCILLHKNINSDKIKMELKIENPTQSLTAMNLVLRLI